jgi:molecular chaperone DnaJ
MSDHYSVLGVDRGATAEEIKRAYRRRARDLHPDANPGDARAEEQFKELSRAYEVLSDPQRRATFDQFGTDDPRAAGGMGGQAFDLGDIFSQFFGGDPFGGGGGGRGPSGPPRGNDVEVTIDLEFDQAVFGAQMPVEVRSAVPCDDCEATGAAPGTTASTCADCGGAGQVRRVRQSLLGQMVTTAACPRCGGLGQVVADPCPTCRGEGRRTLAHTLTVDVPAGIDDGQTLRLPGRGAAGPRGGTAGDLFLHVRIEPDDRFVRQGDDLHVEQPVALTQAALGATVVIPTLEGDEDLDLGAGTTPGEVVRMRQRGVPHVSGRGRGDLYIHLMVATPTELDDEQESLLRQLAELRGEDVAEPRSGIMGRVRSAFRS